MLWYQVTWLHMLVGSDKSDVEGKTPSILQQFKKKKVVEPEASHPEMVIDFNANVPLSGVSTKLKEDVAQATALLLSEIPHMVLLQRKQNLTDAAAYIQCLYRLVANPFAAKQALEMLARSEYMDAFADILKRNDFHATYATLDIMSRLLNGPDRGQSRKVFLSHNGFLTSLLALFQTQHDNALILGRLCHVLESLLSFNVQNVDPLFNILLNHVSMHYAMLVRTLFHFAPPATVESCICILHHMIHTTVLSFTKLHESTFRQWDARFSMENPERMIKQYHSFLMAQDSVQDLRNQNSPMALRLRYRYRAQFLQQWMHSLTGHFDLAIECLGLDAVKYEGSKMSQIGQVKSAIYVVPSGLVVITLNNKRSMYDFGLLQENLVGYMAEDPCGLVFSINGRHRIVYSFERSEIFDRMKALAGQLGIFLENDGLYLNNEIRTSKPTVEDLGEAFLTSFNVSRVDLSTDLRKPKRLAMTSTSLVECDEHGSNVRTWNFAQVHQITRLQHHEERFEIQFNSGKSMWYDSEERDVILTTLLDSCMHDKHGQTVSNAHEMCIGMHIAPTSLITSLLPRCILRSPDEHAFYFGSDGMGMYYLSKISLSRDTFVEAVEEFNSNCNVSRDTQLHFTSDPTWMPQVCKEMADTLMMACKTRDVRPIVAILQAFCWLQHAQVNVLDMPGSGLLEILLAVFTTENEAAIFWAITLLHALSEDATGSPVGKAFEVANKKRIFLNTRLVDHLQKAFDDSMARPLSLLAVSMFFDSVFSTSRDSTNDAQFTDLILTFGKIFPRLLSILYNPNAVVGTFEACVMIMKTIVENSEWTTRSAICDMALNGGLTLRHFYKGVFAPRQDQRFVHQFIASIWMTGHAPSFDLLKRILPAGFLRILSHPSTKKMMIDAYGDGFRNSNTNSNPRSSNFSRNSILFDEVDLDNSQLDTADQVSQRLYHRLERFPTATELDIHARNRKGNYPSETSRDMHLLAHLLLHPFALPDLIWNPTTSQELKYALEEALLDHEEMVSSTYFTSMNFAWNHCSFRVDYSSLAKEIKVDTYYLRILMDNVHDGVVLQSERIEQRHRNSSFGDVDMDFRSHFAEIVAHSVVGIASNPKRFFDLCYQRWLQELPFSCNARGPAFPQDIGTASVVGLRDNAEIWCLQLMVATYKAYSIGIIEAEKVAFVVRMLRGETRASIIEELLAWLSTVAADKMTSLSLLTKENMELFLDMSTLVHENTPLQPMSNAMSKKLRSVKSLKQLQHLEANKSNPFAYFNFFKKGDGLEFGETNIDTVQDDFHGEVYWYVMRDNDLNSISGPHPESILHAICSTKGSDWSKMLLSMYNELAPEDRDWRPLLRVPRIRWRLFVQSPFHVNVCIYTTSLVQSLVEAEIDRTRAGLKLLPVPAGKRYLSDPFSLACVVQLLLCEEADIVESAISILSRLIAYNDATATNLYRCGAIWFMFASASRVSFYEHAKVLEQTHRRQSEHSAKKSILLGLLPEALVRILDLEGPAAFADIFTFRAVDRRVLWTEDMRDHLHDMLQEHLAPFICRLHQDSTALFEYSPMPPVIYSQLRDDIFVYNMHLSRLFPEDDEPAMASSHAETQPDDFDDDEFNDLDNQDEGNEAPIEAINSSRGRVIDEVDDPLAFMRAVHSTWRQEIAVAEGRMAKDIARQVLQIDPSELQQEQDNAFLRARYRAVCLSENIDVEKLNEAFIVLSCVPDSTCELDKLPHKTLSLLLRTQLLFYDTFPSSFQSIPYDAYDLLLKLLGQFDFRVDIENPEYSIEHDAQAMELLSLTMELLLATMISSPWNVEQMLRAKGLSTIIEIADLCRKSQTGWVSEQDSHFDYIGGLSFRVLLAVANTDVGRDELAFEHQNSAKKESIRPVVAIVSELIRQDLGNMNMTILALDILSLMARQETSQECILSSTLVFWHALQLIIVYGNQPAKKQLVWAALRCVRVLAGLDGDSKSRPDVQMALTKLIPMWTSALLMTEHVDTIISSVFSELRVPQYIWFEDMRLEVKAYLDTLLEFQVPTRSFEAIASQFSFDALEGEPVVGGIFLQVYKEGPVRSLPAAVAIEFCELLLVFLYEHALPNRPRYHETLLALECFALLTETSPVEVQQSCLQSFSEPPLLHALGLFMTMGMPKSNGSFDVDAVQRRDIAITCMQALARNCDASVLNPLKTFCKDILAMAELQAGENDSALQCLRELCEASDDICIHVLETKVWLELLSMTIQAKHYVTEDAHVAAETLCAPAAEVWFTLLNGSDDVRSIALTQLKYFLPYALVHSLAEDPDIFFDDFEESAHDAELIWNDDIRSAVRMHLDEVLSKAEPTFPEDQMDFSAWDSGTTVGDLYLDLFLQNPEATRLRHPDHIVNQLLMVWRQEMASIIPLAAQSMIDAPYTLPYLVEQQIGNAALLNKLTNALVFIWREYVDVKASMEENGLCEELLNVLKHCQAERAIGFPQTCVLRLIQIFASNNHFDSTDCLHSLFAPLARKHQDPTLVLDITRTIIEKHLGKPKRQQTYSALQLVRELDVLQVIMGYAEGSADMANVRRPVECRASASSIIRMLQPLEDPEVSNNPAKGSTTPRVGGVMLNMRASIGAPPLGTTQRQPIGSGRRRASMPELHPVSVPQQTHVVLPERPKPTPLIIPQNQVVPRVRTPVNHPYGRFRSDMPSRQRKTISEVSIDTHSVSVDSFIAPLPPPHFAAPDSANHVTDIFGSEPFSNSTSFHIYSDISEESSEFEVDDPSEANFDTNEEEHEEEYDI
ncbi:hypothetical protein AeMF1_021778 [Aphanomyces euteiches]|nr:hypothetical protein AeMF1_021778 [Aphanomyces euteiches]KAH9192482.1 hypothetical protein AeNC1_005548 [Aphanomyces euteiches]